MGLERSTQAVVLFERAMRVWVQSQEAVDFAGCLRLSAAMQVVKDMGVRVLSETRYFGWRRMAAYFIPEHTPAEVRAILNAMTLAETERYGFLVLRLAERHPWVSKGVAPLRGTNEPTEECPREVALQDIVHRQLERGWLTTGGSHQEHESTRLSAVVLVLRSRGIVVDDMWCYPLEGNPYKKFRIFLDPVERAQFLATRPAIELKEREAADAARAIRKAEKAASKAAAIPVAHRAFRAKLEERRATLIALLHGRGSDDEVARAKAGVSSAAQIAWMVKAIHLTPDQVVERCMRECPGRSAEPGVTVSGKRIEEVDSRLDRSDELLLRVKRFECELQTLDARIAKAKSSWDVGKLKDQREVVAQSLEQARCELKVAGIDAKSDAEVLHARILAATGEVRDFQVVRFEGQQFRRRFDAERDWRGNVVRWVGRYELVPATEANTVLN